MKTEKIPGGEPSGAEQVALIESSRVGLEVVVHDEEDPASVGDLILNLDGERFQITMTPALTLRFSTALTRVTEILERQADER